ncbi:diphthamide synthesis protein [Candidatus Woesearchaeota archaeon]|nr:diphthamide synthesis protein [Candidatus Woesearchaeota archaeon]
MELELNHLIEKINKDKLKRVCIQLPDGLKPQAKAIQQKITEKTDAEVLIWLGSCFGACDIPEEIKKLKIDLLVQFGH